MLDDCVVLVTGGGNGIGRECALMAVREGAKVIVNDVGGSVSGRDAGGENSAQLVVNEIKAKGGEAVANQQSVTSMAAVKRMVEQALDCFGALHSVINPAGILRDSMFHKMSEEDWDAVIEVHLRGAFNVTRATIEHFRGAGDGSYVLFTSTTGLIGNIAQANYAAAKLGVVGLSRIIAMENGDKGIRSNVISPFAWTRMIGTIPIKDEATAKKVERMRMGMRADQVATLAVALASRASKNTNGQIFAVRGNEIVLFSQPRPIRAIARVEGWTPETVVEQALPAMVSSYVDRNPTASVFPYDPL
jgi:NAD(P)-dependent dehydrogenase (short-subunit alcohol dehydrogenase family)